jgi:hypothetical protein
MKIEIRNNTAISLLEFSPDVKIPEYALTYIHFILYNFQIDIWYDMEQNIVLAKMRGSIVSMMQFRKFILMNWPNALKE